MSDLFVEAVVPAARGCWTVAKDAGATLAH